MFLLATPTNALTEYLEYIYIYDRQRLALSFINQFIMKLELYFGFHFLVQTNSFHIDTGLIKY